MCLHALKRLAKYPPNGILRWYGDVGMPSYFVRLTTNNRQTKKHSWARPRGTLAYTAGEIAAQEPYYFYSPGVATRLCYIFRLLIWGRGGVGGEGHWGYTVESQWRLAG